MQALEAASMKATLQLFVAGTTATKVLTPRAAKVISSEEAQSFIMNVTAQKASAMLELLNASAKTQQFAQSILFAM